MIEDLAAYNVKYQKENITQKLVKFNKKKPEDMQLLKWAEAQGSFSGYCKQLIRTDMQERTERE